MKKISQKSWRFFFRDFFENFGNFLKFVGKSQNYIRKLYQILIEFFDQIFSTKNFRKNLEEKTPTFLLEFFSSRKKISRKNIFTYVDPKFPPDSKNNT